MRAIRPVPKTRFGRKAAREENARRHNRGVQRYLSRTLAIAAGLALLLACYWIVWTNSGSSGHGPGTREGPSVRFYFAWISVASIALGLAVAGWRTPSRRLYVGYAALGIASLAAVLIAGHPSLKLAL